MNYKIITLILSACLALFCLPVHATVDDQPLSSQEVETALQTLVRTIDNQYLVDKHRAKISHRLHRAISEGEFKNSFSFGRFKRKVEAMLIEASGDTNFEVHWRAGMSSIAEKQSEPYPGSLQWQHIEGGIGYIAIEGDMLSEHWQAQWDEAIRQAAAPNALIIDLRDAGLMSLSLSQHILNHFIPAGKHIADVGFTQSNRTRLVSQPIADNPITEHLPVYILTSPFVAGPWEFVAYTMKHTERATLVGMPTMGLGYMTKTVALSQHINLVFAYAEFTHPDTKDNWQDWGVLPHIRCEVQNALTAAQMLVASRRNYVHSDNKKPVGTLCNTGTADKKT